jgi:hypothetical protein
MHEKVQHSAGPVNLLKLGQYSIVYKNSGNKKLCLSSSRFWGPEAQYNGGR